MKRLTDEQVAEALSRAGSPGPVNDTEVSVLRSGLETYRAETLQWAERRSAAQPSLAARALRQERWAALPRWSLATIAIVTIAAGVAHLSEVRDSTSTEMPTAQVSSTEPSRSSAEEIAADNKLLESINAELNYRTQAPEDALGLERPDRRATPTVVDSDSQD